MRELEARESRTIRHRPAERPALTTRPRLSTGPPHAAHAARHVNYATTV
eukprot:CAMPEP_0204337854 /NCGR_PEP_ID=MMETSP0469-20131031/20648_1 /ASSEMBLY_ACC=CAM_ASM_000384 /TAXON_ID=2969 /ORGANISM="Oxyrrhis marina" /LENGTH=48 /DNA_ID= /DNA_START= /DNA_END= /DNA_ORIENTATION=